MIVARKKATPKIKRIVKTKAQYTALNKLNSFLNKNDKRLARILVRTWSDQSKAITYKELREAITNGYMSQQQFTDWQEDYTNFFNTHLSKELSNAAYAGGKDFAEARARGDTVYTPTLTGIDKWIDTHGGEWITQMTDEAKEAVSEMIRYSAKGNLTVDELARVIRPTIGLNAPQSKANAKYYESVKAAAYEKLINNGVKEATAAKQAAKKAEESALRYATRQHRQRASMIAQTELAFAYNKGDNEAVKQMMKEGLLPKMKAVWVTAKDEAVCSICGGLDGKETAVGDEFNFNGRNLYAGQKETPPAHPRCRCVLTYEEILDANGQPIYENEGVDLLENDTTDLLPDISTPPSPISISDCVVGSEIYGLPDGRGGVKKTTEVITYTSPDGTKFIFPKKYNKKHQTMTPEQAVDCWSKVPESIRKQAQKEIVFVDYYNPVDSYWKKHYKNFTHSYATGGDKITFYRHDYPHDLDYVVRTYCHEAGHFIDRNNGTGGSRFSSGSLWTNAMNDDKILTGKVSPTKYGENSLTEDFAESIAEFIKDKSAFEQEFKNRAAILQQLI